MASYQALPVSVGSVLSPARFNLTLDRKAECNRLDVEAVANMEAGLQRRLDERRSWIKGFEKSRNWTDMEGRLLAVRVRGSWLRARMEEALEYPEGETLRVDLVDYGRSELIGKPEVNVSTLEVDEEAVTPMSAEFTLFGLVPAEVNVGVVTLSGWSGACLTMVAGLTGSARAAFFVPNECSSTYGDLILRVNLNEVVFEKNHSALLSILMRQEESFIKTEDGLREISLRKFLISCSFALDKGEEAHQETVDNLQHSLATSLLRERTRKKTEECPGWNSVSRKPQSRGRSRPPVEVAVREVKRMRQRDEAKCITSELNREIAAKRDELRAPAPTCVLQKLGRGTKVTDNEDGEFSRPGGLLRRLKRDSSSSPEQFEDVDDFDPQAIIDRHKRMAAEESISRCELSADDSFVTATSELEEKSHPELTENVLREFDENANWYMEEEEEEEPPREVSKRPLQEQYWRASHCVHHLDPFGRHVAPVDKLSALQLQESLSKCLRDFGLSHATSLQEGKRRKGLASLTLP